MPPEPELIILTLRPAPGKWPSTPEKRLARLLKTMLRSFGWRCTSAQPLQTEASPATACIRINQLAGIDTGTSASKDFGSGFGSDFDLCSQVPTRHLSQHRPFSQRQAL